MTQCTTDAMHFKSLGRRNVVADFQGGTLTSDGGALLLDKTDQAVGLMAKVKDFTYCTLDSWSRPRRVLAKAEHLDKGANPRFVVTSLAVSAHPARGLYEQTYCGRGEMENRIKEQQLCLFADRTSTSWMRPNQIRLWMSSLAYVLVSALRRLGLAETSMARSRCDTIRLKLLKIGAAVKISVRRVTVSLASGYPLQALFRQVLDRLTAAAERMSQSLRDAAFCPMRC